MRSRIWTFEPDWRITVVVGVVQLVDHGADAVGEVGDASSHRVASREFGSLGGERGAFGGQLVMPVGDVTGGALQFGHVDHAGLE